MIFQCVSKPDLIHRKFSGFDSVLEKNLLKVYLKRNLLYGKRQVLSGEHVYQSILAGGLSSWWLLCPRKTYNQALPWSSVDNS